MPTAKQKRPARRKPKTAATKELSRTKQPEGMSLEDWQIQLRRQFGEKLDYLLKSVDDNPFFSDFNVINPKTGAAYEVVIRGENLGDNQCSCPDFTTNSLGTCKHVEFALAKLKRKRGAKRAFKQGFAPAYSELYLESGSQRRVRLRHGSDCSSELARIAADFFNDEGTLTRKGFTNFETLLAKLNRLDDDLRIREQVIPFVSEVRDASLRQKRIDKRFPEGPDDKAFEKLLKTSMYHYQKEGALFAARAGRCLIGDDMGLGKTIQAIAATEILAACSGVEKVLVVCPTSLKHQWELEIQKFTSRSARSVYGSLPQRAAIFRNDPSFYKITNYETIHRDLDAISDWEPDLVILDEAQRIKNWETRTARFVKRIATPYAIVLTGTPLENRLQELLSIVGFVDQHRLGPTYRLLHDHQMVDETGRTIGYRGLDKIADELKPIVLRRRKAEVLTQLPDRIQTNYFVGMTELQSKIHSENFEIVARLALKWRRIGFLTEAEKNRLIIALQNMRMVCDSSYLIKGCDEDHSRKPDELMIVLEELLQNEDAKVVIFSQWLKMHELIVQRLKEKGWGHVLFSGDVPGPKRKELIQRFRDDPDCRFFLSTDAGGVGLNLQHASIVINMDLPWNPAVLEQRIGRVHRLGQTQPVQVVNFVAQGTIEEGMLDVLAFKKSLAAGILDGGESQILLGDNKLKKFLETVESVTSKLPSSNAERETEQPPADDDVEQRPDAQEETPQPTALLEDDEDAASGNGAGGSSGAQPAASDDPLGALLQQGLKFIEQLSVAANGQKPTPRDAGSAKRPISVETDAQSGKQYLKFEMPEPEVVQRATAALGELLAAFRK